MTTPTERELASYVDSVGAERIMQLIKPLLAAPDDGELREALEVTLDRHGWTLTEDGCHCGDYDPDDDNSMDSHLADELLPRIAAHVADRERKLREEIATELAVTATEYYPEDVFGPGLSTDDTRNISEALAPIGITLDRISAAVMRHAYKNAARIARGDEQ